MIFITYHSILFMTYIIAAGERIGDFCDIDHTKNANPMSMDRSKLMNVLWDVQRKTGYISRDDITKISQAFGISRMELEGVVTFYHFYHRQPAGRYTIYLNNSIISKILHMEKIKKAFETKLGIQVGQVTEDNKFGLFETSCIGLSDQEPACLINFKPFVNLTPEKVDDIIDKINAGTKLSEICDHPRSEVHYTPPKKKTVFMKPYKMFSSLEHLKHFSPVQLIDFIEQSKLAGRGGAFFPTATKWRYCRQNEADIRYLICNADEGEPGTFKDRVLMEEKPELLIEGMILAAYAIGAKEGAIYLRAEYRYLQAKLEKLIENYRERGFLGKGIKAIEPFDFDLYIHLGAGAYVCGEETALIHSMEGKRGEPGTKEYYPVERGFKEKPTVINNVETLAAVPRILEMGLEKWLELGTQLTPGTKLLSVTGDCEKPGIYEIEWGMKLQELLKLCGAHDPLLVQFSGPSGNCLSKEDFKRAISGEDLICGGAVMIFSKTRAIPTILKSYSDFFVDESCGICVPCRTGNFLLNKKIDKLILGHAEEKDLEEIKEWSKIIKTTSRCGLGQMSSNSLNDAMEKFPEVFQACLSKNSDIKKAFNLKEATADFDNIIQEISSIYE